MKNPLKRKKEWDKKTLKEQKKFKSLEIEYKTMPAGKVKWFNSRKGYGFITPNDGQKDIFVHITTLEKSGLSYLDEGDKVSYEISEEDGKTKAINIKKAES